MLVLHIFVSRRRRGTLAALAALAALVGLAAQWRQAEEQAVLRLQRHIEALGGRRAAGRQLKVPPVQGGGRTLVVAVLPGVLL